MYIVGEIISQSLVNSLPYWNSHGKESRVVTRACFVELNGKIFGKWTVIICYRSLENVSLNCPMEFFILLQYAAFLVCFLHLWSVDRLFTSQIFVGIIWYLLNQLPFFTSPDLDLNISVFPLLSYNLLHMLTFPIFISIQPISCVAQCNL